MTTVIRCLGLAGQTVRGVSSPDGQFLESYDPEAHDGGGFASWTSDVNGAIQFPDALSAFRFWKQRSKLLPTRPDGRPNRPLTAFSVEVINVDDV